MSINKVTKIDESVKINYVLVSVSDKTGLDKFIPRLTEICPDVNLLSTGGTFDKIKQILGDKANHHLRQVSEYTGQPETQGGLVKTLDFKIYLGLLTEGDNDAHKKDLIRTNAHQIDMVVVNLYPFVKTISASDATPENARGNIDIGGPCMIRAAAKNFLRVASVVDPSDYQPVVEELARNNGFISLQRRYELAKKAFAQTAAYDKAIAEYWDKTAYETVKRCYT